VLRDVLIDIMREVGVGSRAHALIHVCQHMIANRAAQLFLSDEVPV
jgi:hypothetical protein